MYYEVYENSMGLIVKAGSVDSEMLAIISMCKLWYEAIAVLHFTSSTLLNLF